MNSDRHSRKLTGIRFHPLMLEALEQLVEAHASSINEEVRIAVRERLERLGYWPPPTKTTDKEET